MAEEGWKEIPVTEEAKEILTKRKMEKQAKNGKPITWDDFLLEATK